LIDAQALMQVLSFGADHGGGALLKKPQPTDAEIDRR
jgi:hypothetical protein